MKKVLILAYDFPPYVSVGALRPYSWYRYFKECGIHPIVITRQWNNTKGNHLDYISQSDSKEIVVEETQFGTIIKTPYFPNYANQLMLKYGPQKFRFFRKIISAYFELFQFLLFIGPKSSLYFAAKEYLKTNSVDIIIASGEPFILFKYAAKLSKTYNTPWMADYRDLWSQNILLKKKILLKNWYSYFERKIVKTSICIITVSAFLKTHISKLIQHPNFLIIPNGFDPEYIETTKTINQKNETLNITYVGTLYDWHPLESFIKTFSSFVQRKKNPHLKLNFIGVNITWEQLDPFFVEYPDLKNHIFIYPKMNNDLLLRQLAEHNIMLLFNNYSLMGTKIYDYIGLNRAILLCFSDDENAHKLKDKYLNMSEMNEENDRLQEDLIIKTNSGYIAKDTKHLLILLNQFCDEFNSTGSIRCEAKNINEYSRKHQVERLTKMIKEITD